MATIINNPGTTDNNSSNIGFLVGLILLVVLVILFFAYGLPYIGNTFRGPQINVPSHVDINVQTPKGK